MYIREKTFTVHLLDERQLLRFNYSEMLYIIVVYSVICALPDYRLIIILAVVISSENNFINFVWLFIFQHRLRKMATTYGEQF